MWILKQFTLKQMVHLISIQLKRQHYLEIRFSQGQICSEGTGGLVSSQRPLSAASQHP